MSHEKVKSSLLPNITNRFPCSVKGARNQLAIFLRSPNAQFNIRYLLIKQSPRNRHYIMSTINKLWKIVKSIFTFKDSKPIDKKIPELKPLSHSRGIAIYLLLACMGIWIGSAIATYMFFGLIILAGIIGLVETNKYLKYLAMRTNRMIDIILFGITMYATLSLGITITASLTFAGLGYTLVYAPWLRRKKA